MRIFWVCHVYLDTGLYATSRLEMSRNLSALGHRIHLIVPSVPRDIPLRALPKSIEEIKYIPTIRSPFIASLSFPFLLFFYLLKTLRTQKPDLIVVDPSSLLGTMGIFLLPVARSSINFVLDIRSPPVEREGVRRFLQEIQYRASLIIAKHLFEGISVITTTMKEEISSRFKIDPAKIGIWTSGVSLDLFDYRKEASGNRLRKKLELCDRFIVMYHGLITREREITKIVEAIERVVPQHKEITFFILGSGPFEDKIRNIIKTRKLEKNVIVHPAVPYEEVPKFVSICDVGTWIMPNCSWLKSSSPLKALEYLAMRKPIIASDIPFHREIMKNGCCGLLIKSNNPDVIAEAINTLYENKGMLKQMGKNGRKVVEQYYSWKSKAKDFERFLERL